MLVRDTMYESSVCAYCCRKSKSRAAPGGGPVREPGWWRPGDASVREPTTRWRTCPWALHRVMDPSVSPWPGGGPIREHFTKWWIRPWAHDRVVHPSASPRPGGGPVREPCEWISRGASQSLGSDLRRHVLAYHSRNRTWSTKQSRSSKTLYIYILWGSKLLHACRKLLGNYFSGHPGNFGY